MLLILTTLLVVFAAAALAIILKRLSDQKLLEDSETRVRLDAETYRPLFAPMDEDLKLDEAEKRRQLTANQEAEERQEAEEKLAELEELKSSWSETPTRAATIELLHRASQTQDGGTYMNVCEDVAGAFREGKLADIPPDDVAQLLETHFWLLPTEHRTPGASFRLKQVLKTLDRK